MLSNYLCEINPSVLTDFDQLIVVGDIHGDYESFQKIRSQFNPEKSYLIFLGDYADRGDRGVEVISGVQYLIRKYSNVIALKGNHEAYIDGQPTFTPCDLIHEANAKKNGWIEYYNKELKSFINHLYLAAVIPETALFLHGGISSRIRYLKDLRQPSKQTEIDVLWSDPFEGYGEYPNSRGIGVLFGRDISKNVCLRLDVKRIIRSHQPRKAKDKAHIEHCKRVITISSTTIYGGTPFILKLPTKHLDKAFDNIESFTEHLR